MSIGQKIIAGLKQFLKDLEDGKEIVVTEVRRVETPDGPMHLTRKKRLVRHENS